MEITEVKSAELDGIREFFKTSSRKAQKSAAFFLEHVDYYVLCCPESSFLVKEGGKITGAILSAKISRLTDEYSRLYFGKISRHMRGVLRRAEKMAKKGYDVRLESVTAQGTAKAALLDALFEKMQTIGASGVYCEADLHDESAINFYKSTGLVTQKRKKRFLVMGKKWNI